MRGMFMRLQAASSLSLLYWNRLSDHWPKKWRRVEEEFSRCPLKDYSQDWLDAKPRNTECIGIPISLMCMDNSLAKKYEKRFPVYILISPTPLNQICFFIHTSKYRSRLYRDHFDIWIVSKSRNINLTKCFFHQLIAKNISSISSILRHDWSIWTN